MNQILQPTIKRVALYARVSTTRQAEHDLSIPDQVRQMQEYAAARNWVVVSEFIEPGASATDDRRPQFQRMIDAASSSDRPFDAVLVHSMSRFFRDQFQSEFYVRRLRRARVAVISITQPFEDNSTGNLIRSILGSFDEYQSRENAKHTLRAMQENARQAFWNGSTPPFGYRAVASEKRGMKLKKRLEIDSEEADIVRRIYDLALGREGVVVGIKAIVKRLNAERVRFRGKPFHIANVHRILSSETYAGTLYFNQRHARTGDLKPREEWIAVPVPAIIERSDFDRLQAALADRNPRRVPPRVVSGPTLLTGLARCGTCGSGMTIRTGKGGRYRYYTCAGCAQKGPTLCPGRSISMPALDDAVMDFMIAELLVPERLAVVLETYLERSAAAADARSLRLAQARAKLTEASGGITRLLGLIARGTMSEDDPELRNMLADLKAQRHAAEDEVRTLEAAQTGQPYQVTRDLLETVAAKAREVLRHGDPSIRRTYLRLFLTDVVVSDNEISLRGLKEALAKALGSDKLNPSDIGVPSFVRSWYPVRDSNSCYRRERAVS